MDGLILDKTLKMTNIAKLTDENISNLTMTDLREIFNLIDDKEIKLIVKALKSGDAERIKASFDIPMHRITREKVIEGIKS